MMLMQENFDRIDMKLPILEQLPFKRIRSMEPSVVPLCKLNEIKNVEVEEASIETPKKIIKGAIELAQIEIPRIDIESIESSKCESEDDGRAIKRSKKIMACGHRSYGVKGEAECMPCLHPDCHEEGSRLPTSDELCAICYTCELEGEANVMLGCGHVFHAECVQSLLKHRWNTLKINFAFMQCPSCKAEITETNCEEIQAELRSLNELRDEIKKLTAEVAEKQALKDDELNHCAFYQCFDCEKPYFGGMVNCEQ